VAEEREVIASLQLLAVLLFSVLLAFLAGSRLTYPRSSAKLGPIFLSPRHPEAHVSFITGSLSGIITPVCDAQS